MINQDDKPIYPASAGSAPKSLRESQRKSLFGVSYPTRPPGSLDFIVDNALPGGGIPFFNVEGDMLTYTAPDGFIAIVTGIEWWVTPQSDAIDPAQLSLKLLLNNSTIQGTDTMGIGQAGKLDELYIPMSAGAKLSVRLGRGPSSIQYQVNDLVLLRDNLDPNGFTADTPSPTGNRMASLNGVLYYCDAGGLIWRSFDGANWTNISSVTVDVAGTFTFTQFKNFLILGDPAANRFQYSLNGIVWTITNTALSVNLVEFFEYDGNIYAYNSLDGKLYFSEDFGTTFNEKLLLTQLPTNSGVPVTWRFASFNNVLHAIATDNVAGARPVTRLIGQNWEVIFPNMDTAIPSWLGRVGFVFKAFNNLLWAGFGFSGGAVSDLFFSRDGVNWTQLVYTPLLDAGYAAQSLNSIFGLVAHTKSGAAGNQVWSVNLMPAIYNPELRVYCQLKGQLIKATKGTIQETLVNPL